MKTLEAILIIAERSLELQLMIGYLDRGDFGWFAFTVAFLCLPGLIVMIVLAVKNFKKGDFRLDDVNSYRWGTGCKLCLSASFENHFLCSCSDDIRRPCGVSFLYSGLVSRVNVI